MDTNRPKLTHKKSAGKKSKKIKADPIYCHLCKDYYQGHEIFRMHIMKKHRPSSQYYEGSTDSDSSDMESYPNRMHTYTKYHQLGIDSDDNEDLYNIDSDENVADFSQAAKMSECNESFNSNIQNPKSKKNVNHSGEKRASKQVNQTAQLNSAETNRPQSMPNNYTSPQYVVANNQLYANPFLQQPVLNSNFGVNHPIIQYAPMINPVTVAKPVVNIPDFEFNAKNVLRWHKKLKNMCEGHDKLPPRLLKKVKMIKDVIFDNCHFLGVDTIVEKRAVFKVYEDLKETMGRNVENTDEQL